MLETNKRKLQKKKVASLVGMIESLANLIPLARVYKRPIHKGLMSGFDQAKESWNKPILLTPWFHKAVNYWLDKKWMLGSMPLQIPDPVETIFVNASLLGWRANT